MVYQKKLLVLKFWDEDYHAYHIREFKKLFRSVHVINYDQVFREQGISKTELHIDNVVSKENIDIVVVWLFLNNFELSIGFLNAIRKRAYIVLWFFDDELFFHSFNKFYAQAADAVVTTSYYDRYSYEQLDIPAVVYFSSYSRHDYFPQDIKKTIDVSFVGVSEGRPERSEFIEYLRDNGIHVETYGAGFKGGFIPQKQMNEIFNKSKINLNFTQMNQIKEVYQVNPLLARVRQNKGRPVEIALTGSFCISQYAAALDKLFETDREIVVFDTKNELLEKVRYYLENERERKHIASNAYKKALKQYEGGVYLVNVFNELFKKLELNRQRRFLYREIYSVPSFDEKKKEFFLKSLGNYIDSGNYVIVKETARILLHENNNVKSYFNMITRIFLVAVTVLIKKPWRFITIIKSLFAGK